jgi:hypothetical protein
MNDEENGTMQKMTWVLSFLMAAGLAAAAEHTKSTTETNTKSSKTTAVATTKTAKPSVQAEVVSSDASKKTLTVKDASGDKTWPVDTKAAAKLKALKAGETVTLSFRSDAKGEPVAVSRIKTPASTKTHAKAVASTTQPSAAK